jgi:hypothetical protein
MSKRTCRFVILVHRDDDVAKMTLGRVHRSFTRCARVCTLPTYIKSSVANSFGP